VVKGVNLSSLREAGAPANGHLLRCAPAADELVTFLDTLRPPMKIADHADVVRRTEEACSCR